MQKIVEIPYTWQFQRIATKQRFKL